jgi:catalase (peroxidase I)
MLCLTQISETTYQILATQPEQYTSCMHILANASDISALTPLTAAQGLQISTSIGLCWAAAYAFRVIGQFLKSSSNESEN